MFRYDSTASRRVERSRLGLHILEMPTITIRIRLDYAWDKSLHVQKMRVPALQTLADASQMFRAVFLTCLFVEAMLGFAV